MLKTVCVVAVHLLLPALLAGMCASETEQLLLDLSELYDRHLRDGSTTLMTVYSHGNYSKASLWPYIYSTSSVL